MLDDVDEFDNVRAEVLAARMNVIQALRETGLFPDEWLFQHFGNAHEA